MRRPVLLLLLSCVSIDAWGQSPPASPQIPSNLAASTSPSPAAPLTLAQVLDLAHRSNPSLLAGAQHVSAVRAQEITAGLRQNPVAVVGGQMITLGPNNPNGPDFYNAGIQRLFERGNKRELRL